MYISLNLMYFYPPLALPMTKLIRIRHFLLLPFLFLASLRGQVQNLSGVDSTIFISHTVFVPKHVYPSGQENWGVSAADFNEDNKPDIVTCSQMDSKVNIHINDGKGGFTQKHSFATGPSPRDIATGDLNKDGKPDIATVTIKDGKLNIHLGQGNMSFSPPKVFNTGNFPHDVWIAEVTGDGNPDIITVSNADNLLYVFAGDGTGTVAPGVSYPTGFKPRVVRPGDVNKDGITDLIVGADDGYLHIHPGKGGGQFLTKKPVASGEANWGLAVVDLNKDGLEDLVAGSYLNKKMVIHLNTGNWTFGKPQVLVSGDFIFDLVVADFDLDGDVDVVTASTRDEMINVHLNNGHGIFGMKQPIKSGNWNASICCADFDGDGDLDIATGSLKDFALNIHRNISIDPEKEVTTTCVFGTIWDKDTKLPLKSIVSVTNASGATIGSMQTDASGTYKICIPFGSKYSLQVTSVGYPKYKEPFDLPVTLGKNGLQKDVYLQIPKGTLVFGSIFEEGSNKLLAGAKVIIKDGSDIVLFELTADASGNYKQELPFGSGYTVFASFEGHLEKYAGFSLTPADAPKGVRKDLYLPKEKPKVPCVNGYVKDEKTGVALPGATVTITNASGALVQTLTADQTGYYKVCLEPGVYTLSGTKKGYFFKTEQVILLPEDAGKVKQQDLLLAKLEVGASLVLKNIYYDYDKATLREESIAECDRLIQILEENPTLVIEISSHTDADGSDAYNEKLSQARAQSVVDYLINQGIESKRMVAKGYGESKPIAPNDTPENKQLNRRTEFKVISF